MEQLKGANPREIDTKTKKIRRRFYASWLSFNFNAVRANDKICFPHVLRLDSKTNSVPSNSIFLTTSKYSIIQKSIKIIEFENILITPNIKNRTLCSSWTTIDGVVILYLFGVV